MATTRLTQSEVYKKWKGYQPPGTCTLVSLHNTPCENNPHGCSYIALCPTMRVPSSITWNKEIVYNCMWSLLVTLDAHNQCINTDESGGARTEKRIGKVLMTGFGTGTGGISAERCAQQMALAVRDYVDASTHKEKWRMMNVDDSFRYANDCRRTHDM